MCIHTLQPTLLSCFIFSSSHSQNICCFSFFFSFFFLSHLLPFLLVFTFLVLFFIYASLCSRLSSSPSLCTRLHLDLLFSVYKPSCLLFVFFFFLSYFVVTMSHRKGRGAILRLAIPPRSISFLHSPSHFFQVASFLISRAQHRVLLSTLYIGTGEKERHLLSLLKERIRYHRERACISTANDNGVYTHSKKINSFSSDRKFLSDKAVSLGRQEDRDARDPETSFEVSLLMDFQRGTRKDKKHSNTASVHVILPLLDRQTSLSCSSLSSSSDPSLSSSTSLSSSSFSSTSLTATENCSPPIDKNVENPVRHESEEEKNKKKSIVDVNLHCFYNPLASSFSSFLKLPSRVNEVLGVQHMKFLIVDHTVLVTGANFSDEYFGQRQDRYVVLNSLSLADFLHSLVKTMQRASFRVVKKNREEVDIRVQAQKEQEEEDLQKEETKMGKERVKEKSSERKDKKAHDGEEKRKKNKKDNQNLIASTSSSSSLPSSSWSLFSSSSLFTSSAFPSFLYEEQAKKKQREERERENGYGHEFSMVWEGSREDPVISANPRSDPHLFREQFSSLLSQFMKRAVAPSTRGKEGESLQDLSIDSTSYFIEKKKNEGLSSKDGNSSCSRPGVCTLDIALQAGFADPPINDLAYVTDEVLQQACPKGSKKEREDGRGVKGAPPADHDSKDCEKGYDGKKDRKDSLCIPIVLASPYLHLPDRILRVLQNKVNAWSYFRRRSPEAVDTQEDDRKGEKALDRHYDRGCSPMRETKESRESLQELQEKEGRTTVAETVRDWEENKKGKIPLSTYQENDNLKGSAREETDSAQRERHLLRKGYETRKTGRESFYSDRKDASGYTPVKEECNVDDPLASNDQVVSQSFQSLLRRYGLVVITAAPQANSFFRSKGLSAYIPEAYAYLALKVMRALKISPREGEEREEHIETTKANRTPSQLATSSSIRGAAPVFEFCRKGWTFHSKGIWLFQPCPSMLDSVEASPGQNQKTLPGKLQGEDAGERNRSWMSKAPEEGWGDSSHNGGVECSLVRKDSSWFLRNGGSEERLNSEYGSHIDTGVTYRPFLTMFGSTNFSVRAEERDLEIGFVLKVDNDRELQRQVVRDIEGVMKYSQTVREDDVKNRFGLVVRLGMLWKGIRSLL
ncbi:phospholipase d active site domain-containing protein [Cystoisospora suis]|uniref:CDP-diacylglycerol--glycerol-3-phosphate 1-phosphatidyltransferase n=1 Tax=Cystoisospora suis TaxID=483139 RepID=A0A2C6JXN6_9APIC|nr:phospholipase d active site domain-containing protein [Cystoisospora suis]